MEHIVFDEIIEKVENSIAVLIQLIEAGHSIAVAYSGGKDSSAVLIIVLEAIRRIAMSGRSQPNHFLLSADTAVENPSQTSHLELVLTEVEEYAAQTGLPVSVHVAHPTLAAQFVVSTIGRGTLIRTAENSTYKGKRVRPCSSSWKIEPQERLRKKLESMVPIEGRETITAIGTRFEESPSRKSAMVKRGESAIRPVRSANGNLTISPIADWTLDDVWMMAAMITNASAPFPSPISQRSMERMMNLYRAGSGGTCGVIVGETGNRDACGARFGCFVCCVSGTKDQSLSAQIQEPEYAYMAGLNRFRNYLLAIQWDLNRRELVGRTISDAGYMKVQADTLSLEERLRLLRYLCTLDAVEVDRAEQMEADVASGRVPDTPQNRELCSPQFEFVTPQRLVAIDFMLSMHHYAASAFPAVSIWHEIHVLGRRYEIPEFEPFQKVPIEMHGWYRVGAFNAEVPVDGLRDYHAEQWNQYRHPERLSLHAQSTDGERMVYFEETDLLDVDAEAACAFVTCTFDTAYMLRCQHVPAIESARFWLNETILTLPKSMSARYNEMAKRGQYFANLAERLNLTPRELDQHLIRNAISNKEHLALLEKPNTEVQFDLFAEAA
nr:phosphoadenosine phosphosulfate reductase family protein [Burkholderia sp. Ac-20365]